MVLLVASASSSTVAATATASAAVAAVAVSLYIIFLWKFIRVIIMVVVLCVFPSHFSSILFLSTSDLLFFFLLLFERCPHSPHSIGSTQQAFSLDRYLHVVTHTFHRVRVRFFFCECCFVVRIFIIIFYTHTHTSIACLVRTPCVLFHLYTNLLASTKKSTWKFRIGMHTQPNNPTK